MSNAMPFSMAEAGRFALPAATSIDGRPPGPHLRRLPAADCRGSERPRPYPGHSRTRAGRCAPRSPHPGPAEGSSAPGSAETEVAPLGLREPCRHYAPTPPTPRTTEAFLLPATPRIVPAGSLESAALRESPELVMSPPVARAMRAAQLQSSARPRPVGSDRAVEEEEAGPRPGPDPVQSLLRPRPRHPWQSPARTTACRSRPRSICRSPPNGRPSRQDPSRSTATSTWVAPASLALSST